MQLSFHVKKHQNVTRVFQLFALHRITFLWVCNVCTGHSEHYIIKPGNRSL
jgi:hypothetical protein